MSTLPWSPLPPDWRHVALSTAGSVLLESTLPGDEHARSYLFQHPLRHLVLRAGEDPGPFLDRIDQAVGDGFYVAGYLTYEFGAALHNVPYRAPGVPLAHFGVYAAPQIWQHDGAATEPGEPAHTELDFALLPLDTRADYMDRVAAVHDLIAAGDTYQVNLTTALQARTNCTAHTLYDSLTAQQPCGYAAALTLDDDVTVLSCSPELFFRVTADGGILARPMKGTAARAPGADEDRGRAAALAADEKNRAEHVMIVDLMRNDLGRICATGSVGVDDLFCVQTLPTVHQMVSTVRGTLRPGLRYNDILRALYPSGSITGAPKLRTMGIIHALEPRARGVYTGSIGYIAPDGSSTFSVAIRTLAVESTTPAVVTLGVGGGIVADSVAVEEWDECLLKAKFVRQACAPLHLLEAMLCRDGHIPLLARHMVRLRDSAAALGIRLDERDLRERLLAMVAKAPRDVPQKVRIALALDGRVQMSTGPVVTWPARLRVGVAPSAVDADPVLRYKTSSRRVYDDELARVHALGLEESIFWNTRGELTEGCISTLFVLANGKLLTPPLRAGVLPGVLRSLLLERGLALERTLRRDDLLSAQAVSAGEQCAGSGDGGAPGRG